MNAPVLFFNVWVPNILETEERLPRQYEVFISKLVTLMLADGSNEPHEQNIPRENVLSKIIPIEICKIIFNYLTLNDVNTLRVVNSAWFALLKPKFFAAIKSVLLKSNKVKYRHNGSIYAHCILLNV